jgi:hypothetical protein
VYYIVKGKPLNQSVYGKTIKGVLPTFRKKTIKFRLLYFFRKGFAINKRIFFKRKG